LRGSDQDRPHRGTDHDAVAPPVAGSNGGRESRDPLQPTRNCINRISLMAATSAELSLSSRVVCQSTMEENMGLGRGALLWLLGVPLPIIILLALFWHH
jgi:hypothetical protein